MWRTPDGVAHTVALPDPTYAMTPEFVESLDRLDASERQRLTSLITVSMNVVFDARPEDVDPVDLESTEWDALPDGYLHGSYPTARDLITYLGEIEARWRLDSLEAVDDYLDRLDDDHERRRPLGRIRSWLTRRLQSRSARRSSWIAHVDDGVVGWMTAGEPVEWRDLVSVLIHAPTPTDVFSRAEEIGLCGAYPMNVFGKPDRSGVQAAVADPEGFVWNHADGGPWLPSSDLRRS
jgi:hypothetical protein